MSEWKAEQVADWLAQAGAAACVHLVGIGGCGMSALGHMLLDRGFTVSGSDLVENPETAALARRGARICAGHDAGNLPERDDVLLIYTSAVAGGNPELHRARERDLPAVRRAVALAAMMRGAQGICVAGMHGKTTTASLLAYVLRELDGRTGFALGGVVPQLGQHGRWPPAAGPMVAEADESDGTLNEFHPQHAIVLNVDAEHLDHYLDLEAVCADFARFAGQVAGGHIVYCADDARLADMLGGRDNAVSCGFNPLARYRIEDFRAAADGLPGGCFELWRAGEKLGDFAVSLLGEKNVSNAAAVVALLLELGYPAERIAGPLADFKGVNRRQQELFRDGEFRVLDDYGHHPEEIVTTLRAMKSLGGRRLLVAFQPHRFTRTRDFLSEFANSFRAADRLWIADVYAAGEEAIAGIDGRALAAAIRETGQEAVFVERRMDLAATVRAAMQPGDVVLFLGAGDITLSAHELAADLRRTAEAGGTSGQKTQPKGEATMTAIKEQVFEELRRRLSAEALVREDEPMSRRTTLRVGGPADVYVEPADDEDLAGVLRFCSERRLPFFLLGRGSNLLVKDGGIRGVVICLKSPHFSRIVVGGTRIECGAGARQKQLAGEARRHGLAGLEFFEGIPGTVGGALRMNAGAMGAETFDVLESMRCMDYAGRIHEASSEEISRVYRACPMLKNRIALSAVFRGREDSADAVAERMNSYGAKRRDSQPAASSAGCMFKNPEAIPAGRLVEELGLKGFRIGGAAVSEVHGNFIVNEGGATARDVLAVIEHVGGVAREQRGIELATEVQIVGEDL